MSPSSVRDVRTDTGTSCESEDAAKWGGTDQAVVTNYRRCQNRLAVPGRKMYIV